MGADTGCGRNAVGLLERFEDSLDRLVNGAFARAFKSEVQPVEIASAIQREMDDRSVIIDRQRTACPNVFQIELSQHDFERLTTYRETLEGELTALVTAYAGEQRYTLLGAAQVTLDVDDELDTGIFRVRSESRVKIATDDQAAETAADVSRDQPRLEAGGLAYPLVHAITRLGRGSEVDIRIDDPGASRNHCEIVLGDPVVIRDLNSTNGTLVNGEAITQVNLQDGSQIQVGTTLLVYRTA
ncbi:MAG: FhaA domain-containing protein [Actinomycetales bacterium]